MKSPSRSSVPPPCRDSRAAGPLPYCRKATDSEKRGQRFFIDAPVTGACALCHGGAHAQPDHQFLPLPVPTGTRFQTVNVYERNLNNPVRHFIFRNPDGSETSVWSPDPGRALITGAIDGDSTANGAPFFTSLNSLKIPTLWGVKNTAPYFHDNSAKTLEQLVDHYADFVFAPLPPELGFQATPQDRADIVAYLKLL